MNTLEHWILRIADSDVTWFGLSSLRPAKHDRVGHGYILLSSILCGLPGVVVGGGLICLVMGRVDWKVWVWMFVMVTLFELPLNLLFAHYWNRRAKRLAQDVTAA